MPLQPVISNNTPLSALWSIGQLDLLRALFGTVVIPPQVAREFVATDTIARQKALRDAQWLTVMPLQNSGIAAAFADLDDGEAAVLTLALEQTPRLVIIDERRGRQYAKRLQLPLTGTVGVLLLAKQSGLIVAVKPLLKQIVANGFHLHSAVITQAITLAGETA